MISVASTTVTWKLKNWNEWSVLLVQSASCDVELDGVGGDSSSKSTFRFKLKEGVYSSKVHTETTKSFYALNLELLSSFHQNPVAVQIRAENAEVGLNTREIRFALLNKKEVCVDKKFICVRRQADGEGPQGLQTVSVYGKIKRGWAWLNIQELNIHISVTVLALKQEGDAKSSVIMNTALALQRQRQLDGFADFLEDTHFWDVKLKMSDGVLLPAHRIVLASGSSVFRAMLTLDMMESKEVIIDITDIGSEVMKIILRHIYTGEVKVNLEGDADGELLKQVVYGASKYKLSLLLQHFDEVMIDDQSCQFWECVGVVETG